MAFESTPEQQAAVLREITDRSLRHEIMRAFSTATAIRRSHRQGSAHAGVALTGAWAANLALPGTAGAITSSILVGLGTGRVMAMVGTRRWSLRVIRRTERRCADHGYYAAAAMLCGRAIDLMAQMQYSRTRAALASLDLLLYAARADVGPAVFGVVQGAQSVLADLPRPSRARFAGAVAEMDDLLATVDSTSTRLHSRLGLSLMAEQAQVDDIGPLLVEIGVDLYVASEEQAGMMLDPSRAFVDQDGARATSELLGEMVGGSIQNAEYFMAEGLRRILADRGHRATDHFVRDLLASERLATRSVLTAYLGAMEQTHDTRTELFRTLLENGELMNESALAVIGVEPKSAPPNLER
jgi:hypothetical protein